MAGAQVISPYVRRRRLGRDLSTWRKALNLTHDDLAKLVGKSRPRISDLELGKKRPDIALVMKVLEALGIPEGSEDWHKTIGIARDASEQGWWDSFGSGMGERQALRANLESGASIREYSMIIPGLLQTADYTRARAAAVPEDAPPYDLERAVAARAMRQSQVRRSDGPTYSVVLDAVGVLRPSAPPAIMAEQLLALAELHKTEGDRVSVRVLPVDAVVAGYALPRSQFAVFDYPDPRDGTVVCVDTETSDSVLMEEDGEPYVDLLGRLMDAALSVQDSAAMITDTARRMRE